MRYLAAQRNRTHGTYLTGLAKIDLKPEERPKIDPNFEEGACRTGIRRRGETFLMGDAVIRQRMDRVAELIEGFEDPYGLELLSSVHWVMRENAEARESSEAAAAAVHKWNPRKRRVMKKEHLLKAWQRLKEQSWDASFAIA